MTIIHWIVFICGSLFIVLFSWFVSLKEKRYHGIPRFFVFEGLLLLGLLQSDAWFDQPLAVRQIISWILFITSICYALFGIRIFFRIGKPAGNFENTTKLVTTGLYKYIRHPMYASLLFLGWGMFLKDVTLISIILIAVITIADFLTCKVEESEMIKRFGEDYKDYMKKTKLWIPFVL
jgi:protein-S-isoprenylcysteine O-methyltransferase Ste14